MKKFFSALILLFFCVFSYSQESVERWGKFELACRAVVKSNPFDVKFTATFTNGAETRTVRVSTTARVIIRLERLPTTGCTFPGTTYLLLRIKEAE